MFDTNTATAHPEEAVKVIIPDDTNCMSCSDNMSINSHSNHSTTSAAEQQKQQRSSNRCLRFSVVEEFEYENPEYTEEDVANLWYTMEEMVGLVKHEMKLHQDKQQIQQQNKENMTRELSRLLKEETSWRGLEHMQGAVDTRADRVADVIDAILDAYDELSYESDDLEEDREEALRSECRALTREDRKRAYKYGLKDASIAKEIHHQDALAAANKKAPTKRVGSKRSSRHHSSSNGHRKTSSHNGRRTTSTSSSASADRDRRIKRTRSSGEAAPQQVLVQPCA